MNHWKNIIFQVMNLRSKFYQGLLLFGILLSGCTTINPTLKQRVDIPVEVFSHQGFNQILQQSVDDLGRVDYLTLQRQPYALERYYQLISRYSPDSNPELFPTAQHRLAYWINAYNAAAIKIVLSHYPITGVEDVKPPLPLFFMPDKTGFFVFQRPVFGNVETSLYYLENSVIRERFSEPRIHFALNCASRGCPRLPNYAFTGEQLESQLQQETQRFFSEQRNFRIDADNKTVFMSSILDWYRDDFINWYQAKYPGQEATLIDYIALYLPADAASEIKSKAAEYQVKFIPYDWRLNDQQSAD